MVLKFGTVTLCLTFLIPLSFELNVPAAYIKKCSKQAEDMSKLEKTTISKFSRTRNIIPTSEDYMRLYYKAIDERVSINDDSASFLIKVGECLKKMMNMSNSEAVNSLPSISILGYKSLEDKCPYKKFEFSNTCEDDGQNFRMTDGFCNNIYNPRLGSAFTPFKRLSKANYENGMDSIKNIDLPSPREITTEALQSDKYEHQSSKTTLDFVLLAQLIDHDFTSTAMTPSYDNVDCCQTEGMKKLSDCIPIMISKSDSIFGASNKYCLSNVRSAAAVPTECTLGPRQQLNQASSFLDLSNLYGVTVHQNEILRSPKGKMKTNYFFFPKSHNPFKSCGSNNLLCFDSGDDRVNLHPGVTTLQSIFLREHIRLANSLYLRHEKWNWNRIHETARKILIAIWQNVIYSEFLPVLLGEDIMTSYQLWLPPGIQKDKYNPEIDPSTSNEYAVAASKFWVGLMPRALQLWKECEILPDDFLLLDRYYYRPISGMKKNLLYKLVRAGFRQGSEPGHQSISKSMANHWLKGKNEDVGNDLPSFIIQQGRDHGLASYTSYRKICNLKVPRHFKDLDDIAESHVQQLQKLYKRVSDIDLFVGGILERPVKGGLLGPTFACIVAKQFHDARYGDRFFFTHRSGHFTNEQYMDIRKSNLAALICRNAENEIKRLPKLVLKKHVDGMHEDDCESMNRTHSFYF